MNDIELLNLILQTINEHKITAYEIGKNTDLSTFAVQKVISGETKKPNRSTLNKIFHYLEKNLLGTDLAQDTRSIYKNRPKITKDRVVPFYDIEIAGSIISSFEDAKEFIRFYVDYEPLNDCTAFLPYAGDSMLPKYKSGDTLGVKQIKNFDVILWGKAYLVITNENANSLKTVKNIHPHSDQSLIVLRAINPEYQGDTILNKEDILSIFLIKGKVELNQI